jgi:hypothetical protein
MPTIRIDDDVYAWLKSQAEPFEDTPNSVLRRIAGLDTICNMPKEAVETDQPTKETTTENKEKVMARATGRYYNKLWKVGAKHALYHRDGTWYENLKDFPGALFDPNGYVVFKTEQEYNACPNLSIGEKLNVHKGIKSIKGYQIGKQS